MSTSIGLKTVFELLGNKFFIPDYQRGYRWTAIQVKQLLDDIWNFCKKENKKEGEFYCLQPIVVKKHNEDEWEVIDGQQRLTTIYLILKFIVEEHLRRNLKEAYNRDIFEINYDVRRQSKEFLERIGNDVDNCDNNIDFFHICKSYETIKKWFADNNFNYNSFNKFLSIFLANEDADFPVKVIWYEIEETENNNSIDIFTRLNIGKIPLTNSELIKALFLQRGNFSKNLASLKQIQIATEWDNIEKTLQDDSFWYFIYNPENPIKYDNRIEYIFDLMKDRKPESEYYHTFNEFYKDFFKDEKPDIDKIWLEIKKYFLTFEEWYRDHILYHYIGFLIDCGFPISQIKNKSEDRTKIEFRDYLIEEIRRQIKLNTKEVEELNYKDNKDKIKIKKILLLFNIQTILDSQKSEMRFPFHKFKKDNWEIEHVRSQTDKSINNNKQQLEWINDMLDYFFGTTDLDNINKIEEKNSKIYNDQELQKIIASLKDLKKSEKFDGAKFEDIFKKIQSYFNEGEQVENIDSIANLTLLDYETNRSYKNAFFPIKRKRIIENDANGIFVPIATKNLFLKYYSKKASENMYWTKEDAEDYLNAIKTKLKDFLLKEGNNE